jgi:hypothetical protein
MVYCSQCFYILIKYAIVVNFQSGQKLFAKLYCKSCSIRIPVYYVIAKKGFFCHYKQTLLVCQYLQQGGAVADLTLCSGNL